MSGLLARSIVAFLALPGMVAFVVPLWLLAPVPRVFTGRLASLPLAAGVALLLCCVREFYVAGRGTLAPWSPPSHLVISGPYRFSRNPMYIAVLLVLCGWALGFASATLAAYAAALSAVFHLRVVWFEEPWLARTHGAVWETYEARVPRWLGMPARP